MALHHKIQKEKTEMEAIRKEWLTNPIGPPAPDPKIIDWEYMSDVAKHEEIWQNGWNIILVVGIIDMFLFLLIWVRF